MKTFINGGEEQKTSYIVDQCREVRDPLTHPVVIRATTVGQMAGGNTQSRDGEGEVGRGANGSTQARKGQLTRDAYAHFHTPSQVGRPTPFQRRDPEFQLTLKLDLIVFATFHSGSRKGGGRELENVGSIRPRLRASPRPIQMVTIVALEALASSPPSPTPIRRFSASFCVCLLLTPARFLIVLSSTGREKNIFKPDD